jgi:dolichyl-phosphate beta-glucosyltransferase
MTTLDADLSLCVPVYDESERLPVGLERLSRFAEASGLALEVVVVDDGSRDGTADIAREWAAERNSATMAVRVVSISHRGKGAAVRAGMRESRAPIVGYCDVDLSAGPEAVESLYREIKDGADVAIASRGLPESVLEVHQPWMRELGGRCFNAFLRRTTGITFRDTQCGLKLFRAEVAAEIFRHQRLDGFAFDAELVVLAVRLGFDIKELPVTWSHDPASKVSMVRDSMAMSRDILRIVRRLREGKVHSLGIPDATAMDRMTTGEVGHWWYVAKRRLIAQYWPPLAPTARCLDVGCGGGAVLIEAGRFVHAFGVDLSPQALHHGQGEGLSRLARADASALPFDSGSFSIAAALDVLEHHPHPERLLQEVRRVLTDQGVLIITVPAFQWMWSYADHVLGHYRRYTRRQLATELQDAGFRIERLTYFHAWLLPVAWLFRKLRAFTGRTESADDFPVPALVNRTLLGVCRLELWLMSRMDLPFGLSVFAVARPDGQPSAERVPVPATADRGAVSGRARSAL